jgi:hypothetical protein
MHSSPPTYYIVFTAVTALGVLLQALVLLAIYFALRKSMGEFREIAREVKEKALPTLASTQNLLEDISPKLKVATSNLTEVSNTLRHQANHINLTVEAVLNIADAQVRHIDEMVTATFKALDQASKALESAVAAPARRLTGVVNGVRAGVEAFVGRKKQPSTNGNKAGDVAEEKQPAEISEQKPA